MPCKHYELMKLYLKDCAEHNEPWKLWESRNNRGNWFKCCHHPNWACDEYRQIPKTIKIGNFDVPEPMRERPRYNSKYWYIHPDADDGVSDSTWTDHRIDDLRLSRNICHTARESAIIHAKALFSFCEVK